MFLVFSFLALQMLMEFSDELVPVLVPIKGGGTSAVQAVLTSSKEDRDLFEVYLNLNIFLDALLGIPYSIER